MASNLDRYQADLNALIKKGGLLAMAIWAESIPEEFEAAVKKELSAEEAKEALAAIINFEEEYQPWYSEAKAVIRLLLPDRLADFVGHYERPKSRKSLSAESYRIEDALQGLQLTDFRNEVIVGKRSAIRHVRQQLEILKSVKARFKSSLFDIRQLVTADLFDSELEAASELAKKKFVRAAGAIAGVVLEKHLHQVCGNHSVKVSKKDPGISYLNDLLKNSDVTDVPQWRAIQYLGDLRNLCDHPKSQEPTHEQITELIAGVTKVTKTLF